MDIISRRNPCGTHMGLAAARSGSVLGGSPITDQRDEHCRWNGRVSRSSETPHRIPLFVLSTVLIVVPNKSIL